MRLPHQDLLDFGRLAELLGYDRKLNTLDYPVSPRGIRILGRIPRLPKLVVQRIVDEFGGLEELLAATDGELETVDGVGEIRAKDIREGLRRQQEINLVDQVPADVVQRRAGPSPRLARTEEDTITELMEEHLEDLESCRTAPAYRVRDRRQRRVPPPWRRQGASQGVRRKSSARSREYLTIKILHNDMTVMVPTENAALAGLRRVIDEETVKKVLAVLQDECSEMPKNWNRRFKHNRDKIKTGDIYELAEVVRNLAIREAEKGLSTGEKQMFTRAKKILASELMYALEMDEEEVEEHLYALLYRASRNGNGNGKVAVAAK